jgi:hypothetical protein
MMHAWHFYLLAARIHDTWAGVIVINQTSPIHQAELVDSKAGTFDKAHIQPIIICMQKSPTAIRVASLITPRQPRAQVAAAEPSIQKLLRINQSSTNFKREGNLTNNQAVTSPPSAAEQNLSKNPCHCSKQV